MTKPFPFGLLVARQRSGTGALGSTLDQHPQLHYLGEIFHPGDKGRENNFFTHLLHRVSKNPETALPDRNAENLEAFLEAVCNSDAHPIIDVKYNSLHHLNGEWRSPYSRPWLLDHARVQGSPIIQLTRRNALEVFVSGRLAEANKIWHARPQDDLAKRTTYVDIPALLHFLHNCTKEDALIADWLKGHKPLVTLDYAEMFDGSGQLRETLAEEIATVFGVSPFTNRKPFFVKQAPTEMMEAIENYKEVRSALDGTEYGWMIGASGPILRAVDQLNEANRKAHQQVAIFRSNRSPEQLGKIDQQFHWYKNRFPYFGPVDIQIDEHSLVMYSGNDDLVAMTYFWHGKSSFERHSIALWSKLCREAEVVFDVGCHSGIYSLLAASVNSDCRVVAFEPSRRTHGRFLLNTFMNGFQNRIRINNLAVAEKEDQLRLLQFRGENILGIGASILKKNLPVTDEEEIVRTIGLDAYCERNDQWPNLIKVDVEGAEILVLRGATRLFSEIRPRLLLEVTPETAPEVHKILKTYAYRLSIVDEDNECLRPFDGEVPRVLNIYGEPR